MLGCPADKALICGLMWSVSWCLSLCLESMATGSCSQHERGLLDVKCEIIRSMSSYTKIFRRIGGKWNVSCSK